MATVTMFSLIEVAPGEDAPFIQFFKEVQSFFSKQPGFIKNQLFRNQAPKSAIRFMVVGNWESSEALQAAAGSEGWQKLMSGHKMLFSPVPFEEVPVG